MKCRTISHLSEQITRTIDFDQQHVVMVECGSLVEMPGCTGKVSAEHRCATAIINTEEQVRTRVIIGFIEIKHTLHQRFDTRQFGKPRRIVELEFNQLGPG